MKGRPFLDAIRWPNLVIIWAMQSIVFYRYVLPFCGREQYDFLSPILLLFTTGAVLAAGNIYNDLRDVATDAHHPEKPSLVGNKVSVEQAWMWQFILNSIAVMLSIIGWLFLNWKMEILLLVGIAIILLYLYSRYLKSTILLGNIVIALLCAVAVWLTTLLLPGCSLGQDWDTGTRTAVILFGYVINAFMVTLIREVIKDKEDARYDIQANIMTVGSLSNQLFRWIVNSLIALLVVFNVRWFVNLYPHLELTDWILGSILIFVPVVILAVIFNFNRRPVIYRTLSRLLKVYISIALLLLLLW